jgi:hypothetical protein
MLVCEMTVGSGVGVPAPGPPGSEPQAASKKLAMINTERMGKALVFMVNFSLRSLLYLTLSVYLLYN